MRHEMLSDGDVLRALLGIWEKTCVHAVPLSLAKYIREEGPEGLRKSATTIAAAVIQAGVLIESPHRDHDGTRILRWDREAGVPTLIMARRIQEIRRENIRSKVKASYRRKREGMPARRQAAKLSDSELIAELSGRGYSISRDEQSVER